MIDDDVRPRGGRAAAERVEDVGQLAEPELGRSTTTPRVLREAEGGPGFGGHRRGAYPPGRAQARLAGRDQCAVDEPGGGTRMRRASTSSTVDMIDGSDCAAAATT